MRDNQFKEAIAAPIQLLLFPLSCVGYLAGWIRNKYRKNGTIRKPAAKVAEICTEPGTRIEMWKTENE